MFISKLVFHDKQMMVYPCNGILVYHKKKQPMIHAAKWINLKKLNERGFVEGKEAKYQRAHTR